MEDEQPAIYRGDTLAIMGALADILVEVRRTNRALFGEDDDEEPEENDT